MPPSRVSWNPRSAKWRSAAATISARVRMPLLRRRTGAVLAGLVGIAAYSTYREVE
jgi:hypothetical protein